MKVKMLVGGDELEYDVHEQLNFDPEYVFPEIGEQAGQLAWWYSLLAIKEQETQDFAAKMASRAAEIELAYRSDSDALAKVYGKVTEGVINSLVQLNQELVDLTAQHNNLKRECALLKAMTKGFDARTSLLTTSGSAQKAEIQARLRTLIKSTAKGGE